MITIDNPDKRGRFSRLLAASIAAALLTAASGSAHAAGGATAEAAAELSQPAQLLLPHRSLTGALLSSGLEPDGTPSVRVRPAGFQPLTHPAAVAGRGPDLYIADIGAGAVYRYDSTTDRMAALPGIQARAGIRLYVGGDLSLYLLDQPGRRVLHFARSGQLLGSFSDELNLGRPVAVALDEWRGRVLVADGMRSQLVAFHPMGGASYVIPLRSGAGERVFGIAAMAVGAEGIFLSDPMCGCIAKVSLDGEVLSTFGQLDLSQPGPIAVDRDGRVFVIDVSDSSLKVFWRGELIRDLPAAELGVRQINDVWVYDGWILLSDGAGAGVKLMRLAPMSAR